MEMETGQHHSWGRLTLRVRGDGSSPKVCGSGSSLEKSNSESPKNPRSNGSPSSKKRRRSHSKSPKEREEEAIREEGRKELRELLDGDEVEMESVVAKAVWRSITTRMKARRAIKKRAMAVKWSKDLVQERIIFHCQVKKSLSQRRKRA